MSLRIPRNRSLAASVLYKGLTMPRGRGSRVKLTGQVNRLFVCECDYTAGSKTAARLHRRAAHDAHTDPKDLDRDADCTRCRACRESFVSKFLLLKHLRDTGHHTNQ